MQCSGAVREQVFDTSLSIQAKADDRGKGKQGDGNAEHSSSACSKAEQKGILCRGRGKRNPTCQNDQSCDGTNQNGVAEHLKDTPESLLHRTFGTAARVSDRGTSKTCFMGKNTAGDTYPHRNKESDAGSGECGSFCGKGLCHNLVESFRDILAVKK